MKKLIAVLIILLLPSPALAALQFTDNSANRVDFGTSGLTNLPIATGVMWIYLDDTSNAFRILAQKKGLAGGGNGWIFYRRGADGTTFEISAGRATASQVASSATGTLTTGWQFLAFQWDITNGGPKLFRGTLSSTVAETAYRVATTDGSGAQQDDTANNLLVSSDSSAFGIPGRVALFMFFNRKLSLGEIASLQFNPRVISGTLIFSHLGYNGTGTQPDWSGNKNNGTVTGAVVARHVPLGAPFNFVDTTDSIALSKPGFWQRMLAIRDNFGKTISKTFAYVVNRFKKL